MDTGEIFVPSIDELGAPSPSRDGAGPSQATGNETNGGPTITRAHPADARRPSSWPMVARAMHMHMEQILADTRRGAALRSRVETAVDPLDLQGIDRPRLPQHGVLEDGDERLARIQWLLDHFGVKRTICQRLWHWHMICACLPHIYGPQGWARASFRVLKAMGLRKLKQEVLIQTFRRAGKTHCLAQLFAALLLNVPGLKIAIISTGDRASGKLKALVMGYICRVNGAIRRVCGLTHEFLYIAAKELPPNVNYRSPAAQVMQFASDTSSLEAMPNNPNGLSTRRCREGEIEREIVWHFHSYTSKGGTDTGASIQPITYTLVLTCSGHSTQS